MNTPFNTRINALVALGERLATPDDRLEAAITRTSQLNGWFTPANTHAALEAIRTQFLTRAALEAFVARYPQLGQTTTTKNVGLIPAGNIPLVGFHDWLCIFLAGHRALVKPSEKDPLLLPLLCTMLGEAAPDFATQTEFVERIPLHVGGIDAVIATGSNNTSRYFEQYFAHLPRIIRRNRHSVAVLTGNETDDQLYALGSDVTQYFGLGCRNVSKLYVPEGYDFTPLLEATHRYNDIVNNNKYKNNFDYAFTLVLLNNLTHLNNGCLILVESPTLTSRISILHYEYYAPNTATPDLTPHTDELQCVVSLLPHISGFVTVPFGNTQTPALHDYADGIDTMQFLVGLGGGA